MAYTLRQQITDDIDWYFLDGNFNVIHVASAGGRLPAKVAQNDRIVKSLDTFFKKAEERFDISLNENLTTYKTFETPNFIIDSNVNPTDLYSEFFKKMARRGLFSYDKTDLNNFENNQHHLVARPNISFPLFMNLPKRIRHLLAIFYVPSFVAGTEIMNIKRIDKIRQ